MSNRLGIGGIAISLFISSGGGLASQRAGEKAAREGDTETTAPHAAFRTADSCIACHNGLTAASGEDVSIGSDWRGTMMSNSSRDPYWQAAVRRETIDHPSAAADVEDTCATCHMPMARATAAAANRKGRVFAHLPVRAHATPDDRLAQDGVSCTLCHQIADRNLGEPESFNGGFVLSRPDAANAPPSIGRFSASRGQTTVMRSASGYVPAEASHVQKSELCATCHTLFTQALGPRGEPVGRLPEQTPFLEWRNSAFRDEQSCQSCHMPPLSEPAPIASVVGTPREGSSRHVFRGGNFFVLGMLNRYRVDLGLEATSRELDAARQHTIAQLESDTASVSIDRAVRDGDRLDIDVQVANRTGHKLPTGFPSRRAWLHLTVRSAGGRIVFESGALAADGHIEGNANDADRRQYEPHFTTISSRDDVQIYESIIGDAGGAVTTGLLAGTHYVKDNRLLPRGFNKAAADADIAVVGAAARDADFADGSDRVRYSVEASSADVPLVVEVELRYQPVSFRWARNLAPYEAPETRRFVGYYESMASTSAITLARASSMVK
jgi:hypothetical protein